MLQRLDVSQREPQALFDLSDFLHGTVQIEGCFKLWLSGLTLNFSGEARGRWGDDVLVLDEDFQYDNGRREQRTWRFHFKSDGSFTSTCADVIGGGAGRHGKHGASHTYIFRLPFGRNGLAVRIKEAYQPLDDARVLCTAKLSKWGIPFAKMTMRIERR